MPGSSIPKGVKFTTTDIYGNPVTMGRRTWEHIKRRHPEMSGYCDDVRETIERPDGKRASTQLDTAVAYESFGTGPTSDGVRVLVNYADKCYEEGGTTGFVMTAYPPDPSFRSQVGPLVLLSKNSGGER